MDGDGEDNPTDAVRLVDRLRELTWGGDTSSPIIFAERTRRTESTLFQFSYLAYRGLHQVLTGRGIRFGNFSVIPRARLGGADDGADVVEPLRRLGGRIEAAVHDDPDRRGARIAGQSRLNFVALVIHGLSALSCYSEIIGVRLLLVSSGLFVLSVLAVV